MGFKAEAATTKHKTQLLTAPNAWSQRYLSEQRTIASQDNLSTTFRKGNPIDVLVNILSQSIDVKCEG